MAGRSRRTKAQLEQVDPTTEQAETSGEVSMTVTIKSRTHLGENELETVEKHPTKIHLIDGEKGGVGKSLFARVLIQYFMDKKYPFLAVDADRSNPDVLEFTKVFVGKLYLVKMRRNFMKRTKFLSGLLTIALLSIYRLRFIRW